MGYKHYKPIMIVLVLVVIAGIFLYQRPLPPIKPVAQLPAVTKTSAVALPWPSYGQSALGAVGYGILAENGSQKAVPMASITKIVTALAVLRQKPLTQNQQGPTITLNESDVAIFNKYYSQNGSVIKVAAGEKMSEYQALQAMLLASANNMAESLSNWAFGSQESYLNYATKMITEMGLGKTHVADASGFSSQSVSSAHDLVLLGEAAMSSPILSSIVGQKQADIPVAGVIINTNPLLGQNGVIGIKTGHTDESGGCYLFAASQTVGGQKITLVGAVLGAPDLASAINSSGVILPAAYQGFETTIAVKAGQEIGFYKTPWGTSSSIVASQDLALPTWKGMDVSLQSNFASLKTPAQKGKNVGTITITTGRKIQGVKTELKQPLSGPSWHWRLLRL